MSTSVITLLSSTLRNSMSVNNLSLEQWMTKADTCQVIKQKYPAKRGHCSSTLCTTFVQVSPAMCLACPNFLTCSLSQTILEGRFFASSAPPTPRSLDQPLGQIFVSMHSNSQEMKIEEVLRQTINTTDCEQEDLETVEANTPPGLASPRSGKARAHSPSPLSYRISTAAPFPSSSNFPFLLPLPLWIRLVLPLLSTSLHHSLSCRLLLTVLAPPLRPRPTPV